MTHPRFDESSILNANLKSAFKLIEAFFHHLPYEKENDLEFSLTYFGRVSQSFANSADLAFEIDRCIKYQFEEFGDLDISADINFEQRLISGKVEIDAFYHGRLFIYGSTAFIDWGTYQGADRMKMQLYDQFTPQQVLELYENFQTSIQDIKRNHE